MKLVLAYNGRRTDSPAEAEFDDPETIAAVRCGLVECGHEVHLLDVTELSLTEVIAQLQAFAPELIFNMVEGQHGRMREALYPGVFELLGYAYTGSDAYTLTVTLDKWLTKLMVAASGVHTPRAQLLTGEAASLVADGSIAIEVPLPAIVKPNFEGSSKAISDDCVVFDEASLRRVLKSALEKFPTGVLIEEYIAGTDITVPIVEGIGASAHAGVLAPASYFIEESVRSRYNLYDYRLKNLFYDLVHPQCPAPISDVLLQQLRRDTIKVMRVLGIRDIGRADFRVTEDGRAYFLEMNALPSLTPNVSLFMATALEGFSFAQTLGRIVTNAEIRRKMKNAAAKPATKSAP